MLLKNTEGNTKKSKKNFTGKYKIYVLSGNT